MKKVQFASGELSLLRRVLGSLPDTTVKADLRAAQTILAKLKKAEAPSDPGVNAPELERFLIDAARGKVVALALPNWARYARQAADAGATVADAQLVGAWLYRQGWVKPGSQTLDSCLRNWSSWLGKARAELRPERTEGFGGNRDVGPNPEAQRPAAPRGRPAPGFR